MENRSSPLPLAIKKIRDRMGKSQSEFADILGRNEIP